MKKIEFTANLLEPITAFESRAASSRLVAKGHGPVRIFCVRFDAGGVIGEHPTGPCQGFLVVAGAGWAAGRDGKRIALSTGEGVLFDPGERHSKGSDAGMTVIMVQAAVLEEG